MARKKSNISTEPEKTAEVLNVNITQVLETNYMPYVMTVIVSRAIPEIDGFKPSHRKLLYTMYKMGLLTGTKQKSAKVVGQTMVLNPHGDASIYETLVRLTTGKESLLHPLIESKGSFGKQYSDMAYAASRYTECKLAPIAEEIFDGIDKDAVDFVDNYDGTTTEPIILPTAFPNILVSPNMGIAVGMASSVCSFNLAEVCEATIAYLTDSSLSVDRLLDIMKAPDFSTGGMLLYNRAKLFEIYSSGRGSVKVRAKYTYQKDTNCVEITQIPYTTTLERIKDAIVKQYKEGKIKEITDVRDETDINGLKLTIDFKRGAEYEKVMARLYKSTTLEDDFSCNFNILVGGVPRTMGILEILEEWTAFRIECLRRTFIYELGKKTDKLHLLYGLKEILLDIDKAIRIVRTTDNDREVVPNLMKGFGIDEVQAEYVADIKLRNLNREYILKRIDEIEQLEKDIEELKGLISSDKKIKNVIIKQLKTILQKYGKPRKTFLIYEDELELTEPVNTVEEYAVVVFLSKEGYFKKCTVASLRGNDVQKFKENDELMYSEETYNSAEVLFFTSKAQVYKAKLDDFEDQKASVLGDYIPAKLSFDEGERVVSAVVIKEYEGNLVLFFENGKAVRLPVSNYQTKTNRKKLTGAFYGGSPAVAVYKSGLAGEYLLRTDNARALLVKETQLTEKSTRTSYGSSVFSLKKNQKVISAVPYNGNPKLLKEGKYRKPTLPSAGAIFEDFDPEVTQLTIL
ncbi:MAG: topoisomerase IV [Firmicutes bacterium HGW-Firmicutes-21]|nr:MAG: topoisomerase IV [Firmicutes bacterium HGW-Firmicutes-21]